MLAIHGIYQNGFVKFDKEISFDNPVKVIVTFLEEMDVKTDESLKFSDYSFAKSRELLNEYKGSFSESVVEERRSEL